MKKQTVGIQLFEGLPVVDANKPLELHITMNDVKKADVKNPAHCAAARAGQRELGTDVRVFLTRTYVKRDDYWERYMTPQAIQREIISFDRGSAFEPGEYRVIPPCDSNKLGARPRPIGGSNKQHTGTGRASRHATGMIREKAKYDKKMKRGKK